MVEAEVRWSGAMRPLRTNSSMADPKGGIVAEGQKRILGSGLREISSWGKVSPETQRRIGRKIGRPKGIL